MRLGNHLLTVAIVAGCLFGIQEHINAQVNLGVSDTYPSNTDTYSVDGTSEPGQVDSVSYSNSFGDDHQFTAFSSAGEETIGAGFNWRPNTADWMRDFQTGFYANEENLVFTLGGQATMLETCDFYSGVRALGTLSDLDEASLAGGYSVDWFAAQPILRNACHDHYAKVGVFYDQQGDLHQVGGTFGALLYADCCRPLTIDAAMGFGGGGETIGAAGVLQAAEHDYQLRVGTYLSPTVQAGVSAYHADFDNAFDDDEDWGVGLFANVQMTNVLVQLDVTGGDEQMTGFVNLIYTPGALCQCCCTSGVVRGQGPPPVDPQAWMQRPVNRNVAIRAKSRASGGVGGVQQTSSVAFFQDGVGQVDDVNNNGLADPGDLFEVDFVFTAGPNGATGVSFGNNVTVTGPGSQVGGVGANVGDLAAGEMRRTDRGSDACIRIDTTAMPGDQIFLEYDVTADGQTRRFRTGPYIVGQVVDGTTAPAAPL